MKFLILQFKWVTITLMILITAGCSVHAQVPNACATSPDIISGQANWNWEVRLYDTPYAKTWTAATYDRVTVGIGAPWNSNTTEELRQIGATRDYTKAKGWHLLRVNFGCAAAEQHPWFVLYNKYTGIIRVFVYVVGISSQIHQVLVSLQQNGNRITALGANSSKLMNAPDYFLNNYVLKGSDYLSVLVTMTGEAKWISADFQAVFDPNVANPLYAESELWFRVHAIDSSTLDLNGKFKFTTEEATPAISGKPTSEANGISTFTANGEKVMANITGGIKGTQSALQYVNSGAALLAKVSFKGAYQAPGKHGNFKKGLYDFATDVANATTAPSATTNGSVLQQILAKALKVAGGFSTAFSLLGPVLGMLFPAENVAEDKSIPFTPTISTGDISLTGTIKAITPKNTIRIQTPGTIHNDNNNLMLPYYNCPLGIFNISTTPVLLKSKPKAEVVEKGLHYYYDAESGHYIPLSNGYYISKQDMSIFQLSNNILPVYNSSAGLTPVTVQGAIVFRRPNLPSDYFSGPKGDASTDLLSDPFVGNLGWVDISYSYNPTLPQFEAGNLIVNKMDSNNIEFQTPFVNANCLKEVTAYVPSDVKAFIRVRALFTRNDAPEQPPIVVVYDYNPQEMTDSTITHKYVVSGAPDTTWSERLLHPGSGYRNLSITGNNVKPIVFGPKGTDGNDVTIRASESILLSGDVQIPEGASLALTTEFQPLTCTNSSLATAISGTGCETYDSTWWRTASNNSITEQPVTQKSLIENSGTCNLEVFPNPATSMFNVDPRIAPGEKFSLGVYNITGQAIWSNEYNYQGKPVPVRSASLRAGIYIVKVSFRNGVCATKINVK